MIGARGIKYRAVGHEPWAVMRLALPFSLIPLYLVQRSRVFCILLFCLVLRDSSLVLRPCACSGRNLAPRSIHRPSTFPLQRHVPPPPPILCFPLSQLLYGTVLAIAATQATYASSIIPPVLHRSAARPLLFPVHRCYCGCYYCTLRSSS